MCYSKVGFLGGGVGQGNWTHKSSFAFIHQYSVATKINSKPTDYIFIKANGPKR